MGKKKKKNKKSQPELQETRMVRSVFGERLVAGGVLLFLILIEVAGILQFYNEYQVKKTWQKTTAEITKCKEKREGQNFAYVVGFDFQYKYEIEGNIYYSDEIALQELYIQSIEGLKQFVPNPQKGKKVEILYNPKKPEKSIIHFQYTWDTILGLTMVPLILVILGILALDPERLFFWRRFRKAS